MLYQVDRVLCELGIDYVVAGALARDLILSHVFGRDTGRATRDLDLGICIDAWSRLDGLRGHLAETGHFSPEAGVAHRLIYRSTASTYRVPLDLLPFGGVEDKDGSIAWPPGMDRVMKVVGFAEARSSALMVKIAEGLVVPVASLPSLAALKLIAWRDRYLTTSKDATDFLLIARHYADAGNLDRLYDTEPALLQAANFDPDLAGAILLGKDAAALCGYRAVQLIGELAVNGHLKSILIDQLLRAAVLSGGDVANSRTEQFLQAFFDGFANRI